MYIVTCMCCNRCNICLMTYLNAVVAMEQGHILTYNLKVHIFGGTKLGKFRKFNAVDSKYWSHEISGVFWRPQNIIPAKFLKNFQMFLNFLILFCLYSHQNQIVLNFSWTIQSNCLFVPLFLKKNWIYLSETFLGSIGYILDGQKRQKRFFTPVTPRRGGIWGYFGAYFGMFVWG